MSSCRQEKEHIISTKACTRPGVARIQPVLLYDRVVTAVTAVVTAGIFTTVVLTARRSASRRYNRPDSLASLMRASASWSASLA